MPQRAVSAIRTLIELTTNHDDGERGRILAPETGSGGANGGKEDIGGRKIVLVNSGV